MHQSNTATSRTKRMLIAIAAAALCAACLFMLASCSKAQIEEASSGGTFNQSAITDETVPESSTEVESSSAKEESSTQDESSSTPPNDETSAGVIVIDPGHQANADTSQEPIGPGASEMKYRVTGGTSGCVTGVSEGEVNLGVGLKLRDALQAKGFTVIMVRESQDVNISNSERATIANENGADLFIRLHCDDTGEGSTSGFLTLIPGENEWTGPIVAESARAAEIMHPQIVSALGCNDRGIVERTDLSGFNWCEVPTVLFEMGVMSNASDDELLCSDDYQQQMADAIANATVSYMNA